MRFILFCLIMVIAGGRTMSAAPIDEAKKLYKNGHYTEAVSRLKALRKKTPRDATVNYYLGASLMALGKKGEAVAPLKDAEDRGVTDASRMLVELAIENYDVESADEHLEIWAEKLNDAKKKAPEQMEYLRGRLVMLRNMLERVEKIEIIDSINVDAADFFTYYRLSPEAGTLISPDNAPVKARTLAYMPQNKSEIIWAEANGEGMSELMAASILDDNTIDHSEKLKGDFARNGDADYPFMLSDGMTLYYAATGDNSLGGYDIFMTRRGGDNSFLQPQNVGMPYNSLYNDYMLAIDEATGIGWFASDRSGIEGKVTIYMFVPSQTRVNYDANDPLLAEKAMITSIVDTQTSDLSDYRRRIKALGDNRPESRRRIGNFEMSMGNGIVYTKLDDFKNRQARLEMVKALDEKAELDAQTERLEAMRVKYKDGQKELADEILDAEAAIDFMRETLKDRKNKIIRLETK